MAGIRALLILLWLLSPTIFLFIYLRVQRTTRTWLVACLTAINWILFAALLVRSQTPYGMIFQTSALTHVLLLLACAVALLGARKWQLLLANVALISLWIAIAYAPTHWLAKSGPGNVKINGQRADATLYYGNPTDSEAEAVALVDIPDSGDYFLSFGSEKIRVAAKNDFVHLPGGIWVFKSLRQMSFSEPLPPKDLNQFRIAAPDGRVIEVQL